MPSNRFIGSLFFSRVSLLAMIFVASSAFALEPDQIVLIVNKNGPEGIRLAAHYAEVRHIPAGHTITLDVPASDEIDFVRYESDVVPPIRAFLRSHGLDKSTLCLVTFYGVPFRILSESETPAARKEIADLKDKLVAAEKEIEPVVADIEAVAIDLDPEFKPQAGSKLDDLGMRAQVATVRCGPALNALQDAQKRDEISNKLLQLLGKLGGPADLLRRMGTQVLNNPMSPAQSRGQWAAVRDRIHQAQLALNTLEESRNDPESRAKMLTIAHANFGIFGYARQIHAQLDYLDIHPGDSSQPAIGVTQSCLDNELALLWWGFYTRCAWLVNPLNYRAHGLHTPPVLMVMRLDGPSEKIVSDLIDTCARVEKTGLTGLLAVDAGAFQDKTDQPGKPDPYREFDRRLLHLAQMARDISTLSVQLEDTPGLFPPRSVRHVGVYCGWYSLRHYVPGFGFDDGAVGYHVASLEMVALHGRTESGWVHGLMTDGVTGTLGAVAEPYLSSFPPPDEFFPLLFTGKLTLAEVYWRTAPMTSWMISMIGDPLYKPYGVKPAMKAEDLPPELQSALTPITGQIAVPATTQISNSSVGVQ